ncbi:MAG: queuosine precursor transporter [Chloroflexota bacterium]|nr:queuosine precursor transporter [Chloroflexota bacterium]
MIRAILVSAAYIAAQMLADVTSLKIVLFFGLSMDAGTFIYPITFTLRDLVHKTVGVRGARVLIVTAAAINLVMAGLFWVVSRLPGDPAVGPQTEFAAVLSPVWRIVMASITAEVMAELTDTEIYQLWVKRVTHRYQWMRVLTSNVVSVPLDSIVFSWGAFGGRLADPVVWNIVLSNVLVKGATTLLSLPLIYAVPDMDERRPLLPAPDQAQVIGSRVE